MKNKLKSLRLSLNLTVREIGKILDVDYSYIAKLENNQCVISDKMMQKFCNFYNVDKNFIYDLGHWNIYLYTEEGTHMFWLSSLEISNFPNCYYSLLMKNKKVVKHILKKDYEKEVLRYIGVRNKLNERNMSDQKIIENLNKLTPNGRIRAFNVLKELIEYEK